MNVISWIFCRTTRYSGDGARIGSSRGPCAPVGCAFSGVWILMMKFSTGLELAAVAAVVTARRPAPQAASRRRTPPPPIAASDDEQQPSTHRASFPAAPKIFASMSATPSISNTTNMTSPDEDRGIAAASGGLAAEISAGARHGRRPLRRARHARIQSRARRPPRQRGEGISRQPRRLRRRASTRSPTARNVPICTESDEDLLGAEPPRRDRIITGGASS